MNIKLLIFLSLFISFLNDEIYKFGNQRTVSDLGEIEFYEISDFIIQDERFYISDRAGKRVYVFDSGGKYINSSGGEGRGPGEFSHGPREMIVMDEQVYVVDGLMPFIYVYDNDLNFSFNEEDRIGFRGTEQAIRSGNKIYMAKFPGYDHTIAVYDIEDESIEKIDLNFEIKAGVLNRYKVLQSGSFFILAWYYQNRFEKYDSNFNKLDHFQINHIKKLADGVYTNTPTTIPGAQMRQNEVLRAGAFAPSGSFFEEFLALDNGYFLVQLGRQTGGSENALIINLDGEIVQELVLPEQGRVLGYSHNILYLVSSDEMHVVAYEFYR